MASTLQRKVQSGKPARGGGTAFRTLPAYLAAGAPIEGVVILEAVDAIPDIFKTLANVTGDLSVAAILGRPRSPSRPSPAP
jgi:Na+/H+-dicarboxylate symporter